MSPFTADAYWVQNPGSDDRQLVVAEVPLLWHLVHRVMFKWPFRYFYEWSNRYYANQMDTAPQVHVPISREKYQEINKVLWKCPG